MKKIIFTPNAPAPIGPYSQAVQVGNMLYVSGQIAIDPVTQNYEPSGVRSEAETVMTNLQAILLAAGTDFTHVVKTTIFLIDIKDFPAVNDVYGSHFTSDFPARETVQVAALPKGVKVEISMIAEVPTR
jgi:2-iminobutanoate/2-iminopropanoate deaminase